MENSYIDIISTFGFPIFCVIAMGFFIFKIYNDFKTSSKEREEKLYTVIAENQIQMKELCDTNRSFVNELHELQKSVDNITEDVDNIKDFIETYHVKGE